VCGVALYLNSEYFRSKVWGKVEKYSEKFGYVIKEVEVRSENSYEHCVELSEQALLSKYKDHSTILFSTNDLKEEIVSTDCIDKITVRKIFPSKVELIVSHKIPTAIWQDRKVFYFITTAGEVMKIRNNKNLDRFILVTGSKSPRKVTSLVKFLSEEKEVFSKISSAEWVGDRRWNIKFNNGIKLMLPEDSPEISWNKFIKLQQTHKNFKRWKYKIVDFRIANKVYVQK